MERVRIEQWRGRRIHLVDATGASALEIPVLVTAALEVITREPPASVRLATILAGARFDARVAEHVKRYSAGIRPHVKASAAVGLSPLHKVVFLTVKPFLTSTVTLFDDLTAAKDWLASLE